VLRDALLALKKYVGLSSVVSAVLALLYLAPVGYMRDVYGSILNSRSISALGWITLLLAVAIFFYGHIGMVTLTNSACSINQTS